MKHEEMSDYEINKAVMGFANTECVKFFSDVPNNPRVCGFNDDDIHLAIADYCNNPADWGKLMNDNSMDIRVGWVYDGEVVGAELWPTALIGDGEDYVFWHSDEKIGRAISICYLESKEANNG